MNIENRTAFVIASGLASREASSQQVSGLERKVSDSSKDAGAGYDLCGACLSQSALSRNYVNKTSDSVPIRFCRGLVRPIRCIEQCSSRLLLRKGCLNIGIGGPDIDSGLIAESIQLALCFAAGRLGAIQIVASFSAVE